MAPIQAARSRSPLNFRAQRLSPHPVPGVEFLRPGIGGLPPLCRSRGAPRVRCCAKPSGGGTRNRSVARAVFQHPTTRAAMLPAKPLENLMGLFTKDIKTMDDLFLHTLQDIYYAENKIVKSLPDMIENATDTQLKSGLQSHLGETKGHVQRLEQVFQMLGKKAKSVDCPAIDGIIDEAEDVTGEVDDKNVLDAAIIAAGQAGEHY